MLSRCWDTIDGVKTSVINTGSPTPEKVIEFLNSVLCQDCNNSPKWPLHRSCISNATKTEARIQFKRNSNEMSAKALKRIIPSYIWETGEGGIYEMSTSIYKTHSTILMCSGTTRPHGLHCILCRLGGSWRTPWGKRIFPLTPSKTPAVSMGLL